MEINWESQVLSSVSKVIPKLSCLEIDIDKLHEVAAELSEDSFSINYEGNTNTVPKEYIRKTMLINTLNFVFTDFLTSVKYKIENYSDTDAMVYQIDKALDQGIPLTQGRFMRDMNLKEFKTLFTGNIVMPMADEKVKILNNVGDILVTKYGGDWINFIDDGPKKLYDNGKGLVERLVRDFKRFDDHSIFENENVFNIAIDGNFDDCQNIVKQMFSDLSFSSSINMSGVNSINWARIIAQSVYYFYAYFKIGNGQPLSFSVPTGNFGDIYAGYLAKKLGLPIDKLIVATNKNDILHRAISGGDYSQKKVEETNTPSMDIQIASNFERLLYDVKDCNSEVTKDVMGEIKNNTYKIDKNDLDKIKKNFISEMLDEKETIEMIKIINDEHQMVVDPHTAVGIGAVRKLGLDKNCVVLSTAHPCKFPKAIEDAISKTENLPDSLKYVNDRKEKFELLSNDIEKVKKYVMNSI